MKALEKNLNAFMVFMIGSVLVGAFCIQILKREQPCPLCFLQRLGMLGITIGALFNIRFGVKPSHYAISLLSAVSGGFVSLRQICLHICPGFSSFGAPFWGLSLYTWAFIVFASSIAYIALLMLIFDNKKIETLPTPMNGWQSFCFIFIFLVTVANIIAVLWQCGLGPCLDV